MKKKSYSLEGKDNPGLDASNGDIVVEIDDKKAKKKKKKEPEIPPVGVLEYFKYSTVSDRLLFLVAILSSIVQGAVFPLMILVFGEMIDTFGNAKFIDEKLLKLLNKWNITMPLNATQDMKLAAVKRADPSFSQTDIVMPENLLDEMRILSFYFIGIALASQLFGYLQISLLSITSNRQAFRIRNLFFRSVMSQEVGWFDLQSSGDLTTRMTEDILKIQEGMNDKIGLVFQWFTVTVGGFIIGFVKGWKLTLVILSLSPLLVIAAYAFQKLVVVYSTHGLKCYAKAGAIAEEVLGAIRTVAAFGGEKKEERRYCANLSKAKNTGIVKGAVVGVSMGFMWFIIFCGYALAFWYGTQLIKSDEDYTVGSVIVIFFGVLLACMGVGQGMPSIEVFNTGRASAGYIFKIIERKSLIDVSSSDGIIPDSITGDLELQDVEFAYPSRPDVSIMKGFSLKIPSGKTTALVGSSGCGKSSSVNLIQRFYDPQNGTVLLDGKDIRTLNVAWLRSHIGLVSQEPVLFACSIAENIRYGRKNLSTKDIEDACEMANAKDFIEELPQKYDTLVGDRGTQLSGGQKQRIAIARALVRNPKILLLDEATSALDTESEGLVQAALDKARIGRTTIVVAHRLSTVRTADYIAGIANGCVQEVGSHSELMAASGIYANLVHGQSSAQPESDSEDEDEDPATGDTVQPPPKTSDAGLGNRKISNYEPRPSIVDSEAGRTLEAKKKPKGLMALFKKKSSTTEEKPAEAGFGRLFGLNKPELGYIILGCFMALINGAVNPAYAVIFGEIIFIIADPNAKDSDVSLYSGLFVVIGFLALISNFGQSASFAKSGEELTMRCRKLIFKAMLRQDIGWYDDQANNIGALTNRLSTEATLVQGATGVRLGSGCQAAASLGVGVIIAFVFEWRLALVILAFIPFILIGGMARIAVMKGTTQKDKAAQESAAQVAVEGIESIYTVAGLSVESRFIEKYESALTPPYKRSMKQSHIDGLGNGFTMCVLFLCYAASFYFAAYLVDQGLTDMTNIFKVFGALVFGAMAVGQALGFAPDVGKAQSAAASMFALFDRVPLIDVESNDGISLENNCRGEVDLDEVEFRYPTRAKIRVLRGISFSVKPGQMVALVGSSGCGKSTVVQLIQRFYNPVEGAVFIDGKPITEYQVSSSRSALGLVQQEPILFDYSIRENIAYGDLSRDVSMEEVIEAAQRANIHSFIADLPLGYETFVGEKGSQLSGGQKQRIAIARALIRNPKILLLDEATSALDNESEKVVQEALDKAQEGRTSIVIAHRLSTIRNADIILVFHHGKIRETGTHDQLINKKGFYYNLVSRQT